MGGVAELLAAESSCDLGKCPSFVFLFKLVHVTVIKACVDSIRMIVTTFDMVGWYDEECEGNLGKRDKVANNQLNIEEKKTLFKLWFHVGNQLC